MTSGEAGRDWKLIRRLNWAEHGWLLYFVPPALFAFLFFWRTRDKLLWLDEFFTLALMKAPSLPQLWQGIVIGIDCNPPVYIVSAWLITHYIFPGIAPELVLRGLNIALLFLSLAIIFKIMRRFISLPATVIALLISAYGWNLIWITQEARHYTLYLFVFSLSLLLLLHFVSSRDRGHWVAFSISLCVLVLCHTLGIVYAGSMAASAALVGYAEGDRTLLRRSLWSGAAAIATFAAWTPAILSQATLATPYGWIQSPTAVDLLRAFFLSKVAIACAVAIPFLALASGDWKRQAPGLADIQTWSRETKTIILCGALFASATVLIWLASKLVYPVFVSRYFTPNMLFSFAIVAAASALFLKSPFVRFIPPFALAAVLMIGDAALYATKKDVPPRNVACMDDEGRQFAELALNIPKLPIVTESPQAWFPRAHYLGSQYLLALDWDVVEKYPHKSVNNAVDYNIMSRLREWGGLDNIRNTSEILSAYPEFLVLSQPDYSWLENLRATRAPELTLVGEAGTCKLWLVRLPS